MPQWVKSIKRIWRRRITARTKTGPYRFAIRRWNRVSDIDIAAALLKTHFFEYEVKPVALPVASLASVLVLAPHQDDEIIGAGGLLLIAKAAGVSIDVMFITDGRSKGATPYAETPDEVVRIRNREAEKVCRRLGAGIHHLGISNAKPAPEIEDLEKLSGIITEINPQVILVPWLLDTPKHRIVNHLLWLSDRHRKLPGCEVWGYQVHNVPLPNGYVDITDVVAEKQKLMNCYESQNTHVKRFDHIAMGMAAWNSRFLPDYKGDSRERYVEVFCALPLKEHLKLVERFYFTNIEATYRGIGMAEGMQRIHSKVMD